MGDYSKRPFMDFVNKAVGFPRAKHSNERTVTKLRFNHGFNSP